MSDASLQPYRAQGSAMAVEDAAVLGNLLSRISSPNELKLLLRAYQSIRHARASATQMDSRMNQHIFHLPDGPQQEARDASMRAAMEEARKEARADDDADGCVGSANLWGVSKSTHNAKLHYHYLSTITLYIIELHGCTDF